MKKHISAPLPTLALAVAALCQPAATSGSLRQRINLNEDWRFQRQVAPGSAVEWPFRDAWTSGFDDSGWSRVFLPHSWDQTAHNPWVAANHWRGIGWYRRQFLVPRSAAGQRVFLEFEGASQVAKIWVNGNATGEHVGGYTGFAFDVTEAVKPGQQNLLALSVDDTNSPDIPPANESNISIYGGLYRDVWLHIVGPVSIPLDGVAITTPEVRSDRSTVRVQTEVKNYLSMPVRIRCRSEVIARNGETVAQGEEEEELPAGATVTFDHAHLVVARPDLWHPDHPSLYILRSRLYRGVQLVDELSTRFGIRVMGHIPGKGYTINNEFINLHGVNRRQDYGYLGDALPDSIGRRDMEIIKELGANIVRTAHYVQDKSILEAADELGLLIWEEIPNIKIYDYSPTAARNEDSRYTRKFIDNCLLAMSEMIRRDRNHPSIIIWGLGDDMTGYPYLEDLREINAKAHKLDPTRWTAGRVYPMITDVRDPTNGAYFDFYKLATQHADWKWLWNEWGAYVNERGILTEPTLVTAARTDTGNVDEYRRATIPSELTAAVFQEASWLKFEAMPWMATTKWVMFDPGCAACNSTKGIFYFYGPPEERPWGTRFTGGDYRGLSDLWRIPKASFWFLKAQWTEVPFVHIVGHWTWPGQEGKPKMIRIYSTCDEVELFLNGKSLGAKRPESTKNLMAEWKSYGMSSGMAADRAAMVPVPEGIKLRHGPFIWRDVPYEPGILRAVGLKDGKEYSDERKTAGPASQIILKPDRQSLVADGRDAVRIVAVIADSAGVMVPSANPWLTFRAQGPARLLGTRVLDAVWGIAAINILSQHEGGEVVVTASSPGLKDGQCVITSGSRK
jgi:beta-galactosidase